MASTVSGFHPDWASSPGATIAGLLQERSVSHQQFAQLLDRPLAEVDDLLQGRMTITIGMARQLHAVLGASVEFWVTRDLQYRAAAKRLQDQGHEWLRDLPVGDMVRFGWVSPPPRPEDELDACLEFFDMPSIAAWREAYLDLPALAALRTSESFESRPAAVAAWLRQAERVGREAACDKWNRAKFVESLKSVRSLTREKNPSRFVPELQAICARSGVAVVMVKAPNGCRASGAATFLTPSKALIALSARHLSDDHLWFTFFHEAGHLVLHEGAGAFIDDENVQSGDAAEAEANDFAERILIPPPFADELTSLRVSAKAVIRFARRAGVSPGVVVGQLQHAGRIGYETLNALKRRYEWDL